MAKKVFIGNSEVAMVNDVYTKTQSDTLLGAKQDTLVSGTNIKTINNQSIVGEGNLVIDNGSIYYNNLENKPIEMEPSNQQYVEGTYYKKADKTAINLATGDEIEKMDFDVKSYPNFKSLADDTWVYFSSDGFYVKYLATLSNGTSNLYVCAVYQGSLVGYGNTTSHIMIVNKNIIGDETGEDRLLIYGGSFDSSQTRTGGGWLSSGTMDGVTFDEYTGELLLDGTYEIVEINYADYFKTFAFEQIASIGDLYKYENGELKRVLIKGINATDIRSRATYYEYLNAQGSNFVDGEYVKPEGYQLTSDGNGGVKWQKSQTQITMHQIRLYNGGTGKFLTASLYLNDGLAISSLTSLKKTLYTKGFTGTIGTGLNIKSANTWLSASGFSISNSAIDYQYIGIYGNATDVYVVKRSVTNGEITTNSASNEGLNYMSDATTTMGGNVITN